MEFLLACGVGDAAKMDTCMDEHWREDTVWRNKNYSVHGSPQNTISGGDVHAMIHAVNGSSVVRFGGLMMRWPS